MERSAPEVAQALDVFNGSWEVFKRCSESAKVFEDDDVIAFASGGPYAITNQAVIKRIPEHAERTIAGVVNFFGALPFLLNIPDDCIVARAAAEAAGLGTGGGPPFMVCSPADAVTVSSVDGVEVSRVSDRDALRDHCAAMAAGFGMPEDVPGWFFPEGTLGVDDVGLYNATLDGEVVATAVGAVAAGGVAIYCVATLERARRRGIGEAVTAAAIAHGVARGASVAVLQASDLGRPVYERMGFQERGRHTWYAPKPKPA